MFHTLEKWEREHTRKPRLLIVCDDEGMVVDAIAERSVARQ